MFFIFPALKRSHGAFAAGRGACRFVAWKGITGIPGVMGRNMIGSVLILNDTGLTQIAAKSVKCLTFLVAALHPNSPNSNATVPTLEVETPHS